MANGVTTAFRVNIVDKYDPRILGAGGLKGSTFTYIPDVGDAELLIKQDNGYSTNWVSVANSAMPITIVDAASVGDVDITNAPADVDGVLPGPDVRVLLWQETLPEQNGVYDYPAAAAPMTRSAGWDTAEQFVPGRQVFSDGGTTNANKMFTNADSVATLDVDPVTFVPSGAAVVGTPNTQAYFDAAGNLTSNAQASFDETTMSITRGLVAGGGAITNTGVGSVAQGSAQVAGSLIDVQGNGAIAMGSITGTGGTVQALANGLVIGRINDGGTIQINLAGSMAVGHIDGGGNIITTQFGCLAMGKVQGGGSILAGTLHDGSLAFGFSDAGGVIESQRGIALGYVGGTSNIRSEENGALANGYAETDANIIASGVGATALGIALGNSTIISSAYGTLARGAAQTNSQIEATLEGAHASGFANNSGVISASGVGSHASGVADAGTITAGFDGVQAIGVVLSGGNISSAETGAVVGGHAETSGVINTSGSGGSIARGHASNSGTISCAGPTAFGAFAGGRATGAGSIINSSGSGSFCYGFAQNGFTMLAAATGSFAVGFCAVRNHSALADGSFVIGGDNQATGVLSGAVGYGNTISVVRGFICGQFGSAITDELFSVGNGGGIGTEALAFAVHASGRIDQNGSQKGVIRAVAASDVVSSGTDHKLVLNDNAAGANTLTLPAGIEGLEYVFSPSAANTGTWALTPDGADVLDGNIPADLAATPTPKTITFLGGTWYLI